MTMVTEKGLDFSTSRPLPAQIKADGYKFVNRYLSWEPNTKVLNYAEAHSYLIRGIDIHLNWEFDAHDGAGGAAKGRVHAIEAVRQARALGYGPHRTIYFSTGDFDVIGEGKVSVCDSYIRAASDYVRNTEYRMGEYSGFHYLDHLWGTGLIDDGWQSPSKFGHPGWRWDSRNHIHQTQLGVNYHGSQVDINEKVGPTYSWLSPWTPPIINNGDEESGMGFFIQEAGQSAIYFTNGLVARHVADMTDFNRLQFAIRKAGYYAEIETVPLGSVAKGSYGRVM